MDQYNEKMKNSLKRDDVDWSCSKVIFISPSFNTYQKKMKILFMFTIIM